jgi:hypothetical protein
MNARKRPLMEYLSKLPKAVPAGRVLVHNSVKPARTLGTRGFRAWLSDPDPKNLEACDCGWAPTLGGHYRVKGGRRRKIPQGGGPDAVQV